MKKEEKKEEKKLLFKKFGGEYISDIIEYVKNIVINNPNIVIAVGCDSQNLRRCTAYATTIVMHDHDKRNGAHVVFKREFVEKTRGEIDAGIYGMVDMRLYNEVSKVLDLCLLLQDNLKGIYVRPDIPFTERSKYGLVNAHLDLNPDPGNGHNKSNRVYAAGKGTLESYGFITCCKPNAYAASSASDLLCKM